MDRYQKYFKAVGDYTWNEGKDSAREANEEERQERLSFKIGYIFFVLQDCSSDWVYCKCLDTGDMGFVPTTLIEEVVPVFAVAVKDQTRDVEQTGVVSKVYQHLLPFKKGDIIKIFLQYPSGWWKGECNKIVGVFPPTAVERLPAPDGTAVGWYVRCGGVVAGVVAPTLAGGWALVEKEKELTYVPQTYCEPLPCKDVN